MRLFTGIALPSEVTDKLAGVLNDLKPTARINWSPVPNLHITCKFIGRWPEDRLPEMEAALKGVGADGPIPITVSRFGFFPNPHRPHSLFSGVQAGSALPELVSAIDHALAPLGCAVETREYHPHVTLARIKGTADLIALREHIAQIANPDFGSFEAREFHLYSSQPGPRGSVYTKLATYDLMREKNENA